MRWRRNMADVWPTLGFTYSMSNAKAKKDLGITFRRELPRPRPSGRSSRRRCRRRRRHCLFVLFVFIPFQSLPRFCARAC